MGANNTVNITDQKLYEARLGGVIVGDNEQQPTQTLYYQRDERLFLMRTGEAVLKNKTESKRTSFSNIL